MLKVIDKPPRSLTQVTRWLLEDGRFSETSRALMDGLTERLLALDVPLWRAAFNIGTIHTQVIGVTTHWYRADGQAEETRWPRRMSAQAEAVKSPIQKVRATGRSWRCRLDDAERLAPFPLLTEFAAAGATDYLCCPMPFSAGNMYTATWTSDAPGGFTARDIRRLNTVTRYVAPVLEAIEMRRVQENLLEAYVGPLTGRRVLAEGGIERGQTETIYAVIWSCDLRGFSGLTYRLPQDQTIATLNRFFEIMAGPVESHQGEVLKFIGDGMLAIFPFEKSVTKAEACVAAVDAAREAERGMSRFNLTREGAGEQRLNFGIGLHLGAVGYGNIGTATRLDFTVIGPAVNLASRLQQLSQPLGCSTVLSDAVAKYVPDRTVALGARRLRGQPGPVMIHTLKDEA
ncbi:MAG: adenylate/guanylate cyclase domain-containing protein [Alphaproteobacteria bacterium]|nr:adenylate/guanylate cyclase domain-containing protein [Alphaproteobacteria bacterium]